MAGSRNVGKPKSLGLTNNCSSMFQSLNFVTLKEHIFFREPLEIHETTGNSRSESTSKALQPSSFDQVDLAKKTIQSLSPWEICPSQRLQVYKKIWLLEDWLALGLCPRNTFVCQSVHEHELV